jgi:hypothetical protein
MIIISTKKWWKVLKNLIKNSRIKGNFKTGLKFQRVFDEIGDDFCFGFVSLDFRRFFFWEMRVLIGIWEWVALFLKGRLEWLKSGFLMYGFLC